MAFFALEGEGEGADITTFRALRFGPNQMISTLLFSSPRACVLVSQLMVFFARTTLDGKLISSSVTPLLPMHPIS